MPSQHANPGLTVRPPVEVKDAAQAVLTERGKEMQGFVTACLATLAAEPDRLLRLVGRHWPPPRRRGRPPQQKAGTQSE